MPNIRHIIIALVLICLLPLPVGAQGEKVKKSILYLNSYHNGYRWSDYILNGVRSVLDESEYKIDLQIEYLDAKKYNYDDVTRMLLNIYAEKFANEHFDVVMVSDNDAFTFASQYRDRLFPGVPLVFCGVNDLSPEALAQGNLTGVEENFDLRLTLDVALKLHPDTSRMVVVGDESTAGVTIRRQIEAEVPLYRDRLEVEYWTHMDLPSMLDRVEVLPPDTFLFFIPFYQTIGGRFYTTEEVMRAIYNHAKVPIYTAWEFLLGHGAVGGRLISGFQHGQTAAALALRILGGEKADDVPVYREPTGEYGFDYDVMRRLNIDQAQLPEGSRIINAPKAFYELPKELFWTIIISFCLLIIVMVFLMLTMLERRKVERKVKDQLAFQETLMDAVPQLVSWKDVRGNYLGTNRAFARFFGFEDDSSIVAKPSIEVITDTDYREWAVNADKDVVAGRDAYRKVKRKLVDAQGTHAWVEVSKVPIRDQAGLIVGVLSTVENITRERNLEKQLLQSQKMEAIGTLAGGIAHDFNNILTSIINSTELAVGDIDSESMAGKDLQRVLKAARRGGRVVKQILAFSRPSTEGFRSTDVGVIVSEALGLLEASMPGNIDVRSRIEPGLSCVHADPTQLHQVTMNLCTNAFHALRDEGGGTIEARVELADMGQEDADMLGLEPGEYVLLSIEDNGPGIPPEIVDNIFDPFFSTKDKTEGTGLGLAVVHGIVRSHKGGLRVSSVQGSGTVFEIYLPKSEQDNAANANRLGVVEPGGASILFVEDDEDQLDTTPRLLETMGYRVEGERDPSRAVGMVVAEPQRFDLIITDYDMPGLSGAQLARQVYDVAPSMPIILVSGREDAATAAVDLPNIRKVVIKPYDKDVLSGAIAEVLRNETTITDNKD